MNLRIYQVDAFTSTPFAGNPAAVCILKTELPDEVMQDIAAEMNLSETAFVHLTDEKYRIRWFTPATEVQLCGHATLAAAHVLWEQSYVPVDRSVQFCTKSGSLTAEFDDGSIQLNFPAEPGQQVDPPEELIDALAVKPVYVGKNRFDYLVEVQSECVLRDIRPDCDLIESLGVRGVVVTSESASDGWDFVSRFFAPAVGVDEDPVTGSAHCYLGPYWSSKLGCRKLTGYQASSRGGTVTVQCAGERVILGGQAVTVIRGQLQLPVRTDKMR